MGTCGGCNFHGDTKEKKILCAVDGQWYEELHTCERWTEYSYGMSRSERLADAKSIKEREAQEIRHDEILQESKIDREHQDAVAKRPTKRSRRDWALSIVAIGIALWAASSAHEANQISKGMMSIQERENRPYISVSSAKVEQYPSIEFYKKPDALHLGEVEAAGPIFGSEIVLKNIGTHPASQIFTYVLVWREGDDAKMKVAGISSSNELYDENISALYTHVWAGSTNIPVYYIIIGTEYQDSMNNSTYEQNFYFSWSGVKNGLYREGLNILSSIEVSEIKEKLSFIDEVKKQLKEKPMGNSQIKIDEPSPKPP